MTVSATVTDSRTIEHILRQGWEAYRHGDLEHASARYTEAVERSPADASLWYDLGCLYGLTGHQSHAIAALQYSLALEPRRANVEDALGQLFELTGDDPAARQWYTLATIHAPHHPPYLRRLANLLLRLQEYDVARQALRQLRRADTQDALARYQLGVLELRADAPDLAIQEFLRVVELSPDHVPALNGLGLAYTRIGAFSEASGALERAKQLEPGDPSTPNNLGVLAASQRRWEEARDAWTHALLLMPTFAPALRNLEWLATMPEATVR